MNLNIQDLKNLKPEFEKLQSYSEKLSFWDEHFWSDSMHFNWTYFFSENEDEAERYDPKNLLTIYPKDKSETELFNAWSLNHVLREPHWNFENQKGKYFEIIQDNPQPLEYTKQETESIINQLEKEKKCMIENKDIFTWGYYFGYQCVVHKKKIPPPMDAEEFNKIKLSFAKGICDAHFLGFLQQQREILINEKKADNSSTFIQPMAKTKSTCTNALIYELNNFHLFWKSYLSKEIAEKYNRSEYALHYNNWILWDVYDGGSRGTQYKDLLTKLYNDCINEINSNLNNYESKDARISFLKRVLLPLNFFTPKGETKTYLSLQEEHVQFNIDYLAGHDFSVENDCSYEDFITIKVSGFNNNEFQSHHYGCLLVKEYEGLTEQENDELSFVKTILSIKRNTIDKLHSKIRSLLNIETENHIDSSFSYKKENFTDNKNDTNFLYNTIKEYLEVLKSSMTEDNFIALTDALYSYFNTGRFPLLNKKIRFKTNINMKNVGWTLNQLYRAEKENQALSKEYLQFAKDNISIFEDVAFDNNEITKTNLYRYFTQKQSK